VPSTANRLLSMKRAKTLGLSVVDGNDGNRKRVARRRAEIAIRVAQLTEEELEVLAEVLDGFAQLDWLEG
jgi:FixJ family two-component response regulator